VKNIALTHRRNDSGAGGCGIALDTVHAPRHRIDGFLLLDDLLFQLHDHIFIAPPLLVEPFDHARYLINVHNASMPPKLRCVATSVRYCTARSERRSYCAMLTTICIYQ